MQDTPRVLRVSVYSTVPKLHNIFLFRGLLPCIFKLIVGWLEFSAGWLIKLKKIPDQLVNVYQTCAMWRNYALGAFSNLSSFLENR